MPDVNGVCLRSDAQKAYGAVRIETTNLVGVEEHARGIEHEGVVLGQRNHARTIFGDIS